SVDAGEQVVAPDHGDVPTEGAVLGGALPGGAGLTGADLPQNFLRGVGHEGGEENGGDAQHLQQVVHDGGQTGAVGLHILGQHPGGGLVNVLVGPADDLEDLRQGVLEGVVLHLLLIAAPQSGGQGDQLLVQSVRLPRLGQGAVKV